MQNSAWINLLRRLPPEQHATLVVVTSVGVEISIQNILRIEEDHVVLRGRLAGTTDTGRGYFLPYSQINYLGLQKHVTEAEISALYGEAPQVVVAVASKAEEGIAAPPSAALLPAEPEVKPSAPPPPASSKPTEEVQQVNNLRIPRRSGLLQRLKARNVPGGSPTTQSKP